MSYHFGREVFHYQQNAVQCVFQKNVLKALSFKQLLHQDQDLYSNNRKY